MIENKPLDLDDIHDHPLNAQIFVDSFNEESIQALAEDIEQNGLAQPPLIADIDGVTTKVDGHRRIAAMKWLRDNKDKSWGTLTDYRHLGTMTSDDALRRILSASRNTRVTSPREEYLKYQAALGLFQREEGGRGGDRRSEEFQSRGTPTLKKDLIKHVAQEAGLTPNRVHDLTTIFESDLDEIKEAVARGEMSVYAASKEIKPKKPQSPRKAKEEDNTKVEPDQVESTQVEEVSIEPKEAATEDTKEDEPPQTNPVEATEPVEDDEPDIDIATNLLKGLTAERCAELILMAIRGSDFADDTNAIMEPICRGLGMGWGDDEPSSETEEGEGDEESIEDSEATTDDPDEVLIKVAPAKSDRAKEGIAKLIGHIDKTPDPQDIIKTIAFNYDYVEEAGKANAAKYVSSIANLDDPNVRDEIVRGLMLHYGLAESSEPSSPKEVEEINWESMPLDAKQPNGKPVWSKPSPYGMRRNQVTQKDFPPKHFGLEDPSDAFDEMLGQFG